MQTKTHIHKEEGGLKACDHCLHKHTGDSEAENYSPAYISSSEESESSRSRSPKKSIEESEDPNATLNMKQEVKLKKHIDAYKLNNKEMKTAFKSSMAKRKPMSMIKAAAIGIIKKQKDD